MTATGADAQPIARDFSSIERSVLRRARIEEGDAARYPPWFGVAGVVELIRAGVTPEIAGTADPMLSGGAVIAFLGAGLSLDGTAYDERFLDPGLLAEQGVPASMANAFPSELTEVDVLRLHDSGATPDMVAPFGDGWSADDVAKLVAGGVRPAEARPFLDTTFIPADAVAMCVRSGVDPARLDTWLEIVGAAVRAGPRSLVAMALENDRIDDPEGFRQNLLKSAISSIDEADNPRGERQAITDALLAIVGRGGILSTSVPSAWNRQRILHVGVPLHERAVIAVLPDEPVRFGYGAIDTAEGIRSLHRYAEELIGVPGDP